MRQAHVIMSKWLSLWASLKSFQQPHREKDGGEGGGKDRESQKKLKVVRPFAAHGREWSR